MGVYWKISRKATELNKHYYDLYHSTYNKVLFSYFRLKDFEDWRKFISYRSKEIDVMLDSGAFSIWKAGKGDVDLEEYINYCLKLQRGEEFKSITFVCLDKIPGTIGRAASVHEIKDAAELSLENYKRMKEAGVENVLPVYHLGEELSCLKKIIDTGATYIGVGGLARAVGNRRKGDWLDTVFGFLRGYSEMKVHGFGMTDSSLLLRYPFFSADSCTPHINVGFGFLTLFNKEQGRLKKFYIQGMRSYMKSASDKDKKLLAERFNIKFEDLLSFWCRNYFCLLEWLKFEKFVNKQKEKNKTKPIQQSLLGAIK